MATAKKTEVTETTPANNEKLVSVFIPKERGLNAKDEYVITVNGMKCVVPLGKHVDIPDWAYERLLCIEQNRDYADNNIKEGIEEI